MRGADWTERYPRVVDEVRRIKGSAIIDAELVCLSEDGKSEFDRLHSRCFDREAIACVFDLLNLNGDDLRRSPW
jgi:bifunctional non-homologous end joining protein LigD